MDYIGMEAEKLSTEELTLPMADIDLAQEDLSLNLDPRGTRIVNSLAHAPRTVGLPGHVLSPIHPVRYLHLNGFLPPVTRINSVKPPSFQQWTS